MHHPEQHPVRTNKDNIGPAPFILHPDLAEFLKHRDFACVTHPTDMGTVFVVKAPGKDIDSVRGRVPIELNHELYNHPAAPVIRTVMRIYDEPERPLALETFTNVEDLQQATDFANLGEQEELYLLFFDETLPHRLTKAVHLGDREIIMGIMSEANTLLAAIPKERFNFEQAKAAVMAATKL